MIYEQVEGEEEEEDEDDDKEGKIEEGEIKKYEKKI